MCMIVGKGGEEKDCSSTPLLVVISISGLDEADYEMRRRAR